MIGLVFNNTYSQGDLDYGPAGIRQDETLKTAILVSLFTDRRANEDDDYPEGQKYGWWGDTFAEVPGDKIGSRLWQLKGQPLNEATISLADDLVKEALQWMIDDGVTEEITTEIQIVEGRLKIGISIKRPVDITARYYDIWEGTFAD